MRREKRPGRTATPGTRIPLFQERSRIAVVVVVVAGKSGGGSVIKSIRGCSAPLHPRGKARHKPRGVGGGVHAGGFGGNRRGLPESGSERVCKKHTRKRKTLLVKGCRFLAPRVCVS